MKILLLTLSLILSVACSAQVLDKVQEIFEIHTNKKRAERDSSIYPAKLVLAPVVQYSPETNWGFGVGAKFLFKFPGAGEETRTSNMPMSLIYTLNHQVILYSGYHVFFNKERYILKGNFEFSRFPRLFFGVGRDTPESNEELIIYNRFLLEPLLLKNISGYWFAGGGMRFNYIYNVSHEGNLPGEEEFYHGYNGSRSLGFELALSYDNRDNVVNPQDGSLLELTAGYYPGGLSSSEFSIFRTDFRKYFPVIKRLNHILALQLITYFTFGDVPLIEMAALGGDMIMRGYYDGRYIHDHHIAAQAEYRFPIWNRFGGVVFFGMGDVTDGMANWKVENLRYSVGFGLRFKIVPEENLNVRFDYGMGMGTRNYYLDIAEAF